MDLHTKSVPRIWCVAAAFDCVLDYLRHPDWSGQEENAKVIKIYILNENYSKKGRDIYLHLHSRGPLVLLVGVCELIHALYFELVQQHPVCVEEEQDELKDERELERNTDASTDHWEFKVYHETPEVHQKEPNVDENAELIGITWEISAVWFRIGHTILQELCVLVEFCAAGSDA